jgi:hypothetical protein
LAGGPARFTRDFTCPALLRIPVGFVNDSRTGLSPPAVQLSRCFRFADSLPRPGPTTPELPRQRRFGLIPFRSPLLRESLLFSFPAGTEMFQFPAFASRHGRDDAPLNAPGCPIRKPADRVVLANPRGLSQLITSFFAFQSLGIPRVPFSHFPFKKPGSTTGTQREMTRGKRPVGHDEYSSVSGNILATLPF